MEIEKVLQTQIDDLKNKYEQLRVKINSHVERGDIHKKEGVDLE